MTEDLTLQKLVEMLPPRIWYLTSNGTDMWCRRPYGFLFSSGQDAEAFARAMGIGEELFAIGVDAGAMISDAMLAGLRDSAVTRLFIDPAFDPDTGDVHGKILRLAPPAQERAGVTAWSSTAGSTTGRRGNTWPPRGPSWPNTSFLLGDFTTARLPEVDYVIASGALGYRSQERDFVVWMIDKLYASCWVALGFDLLCHIPDGETVLAACDPETIGNHCRRLASRVSLRDGYLPGIIP